MLVSASNDPASISRILSDRQVLCPKAFICLRRTRLWLLDPLLCFRYVVNSGKAFAVRTFAAIVVPVIARMGNFRYYDGETQDLKICALRAKRNASVTYTSALSSNSFHGGSMLCQGFMTYAFML